MPSVGLTLVVGFRMVRVAARMEPLGAAAVAAALAVVLRWTSSVENASSPMGSAAAVAVVAREGAAVKAAKAVQVGGLRLRSWCFNPKILL